MHRVLLDQEKPGLFGTSRCEEIQWKYFHTVAINSINIPKQQ